MAKRRKRYCQHCGGEFKSWHAHQDCKPQAEPEAQPQDKPPFRPRIVTGGATMWMRSRG